LVWSLCPIAGRVRQRFVMFKHRAEIADVEPPFKEVKWVDCGTGGCTPRAV
jgi:hypothetical protein